MDSQLRTNWSRLLDRLLHQVHPVHRTLFGKERLQHYWSADETYLSILQKQIICIPRRN